MRSHQAYYSNPVYDRFRAKIKYMDIPLVYDYNISTGLQWSNNLRFIYTGFMSSYTADPSYFIKFLQQEQGELPEGEFEIYGSTTPNINETIKLGNSRKIHIHGSVSHDQIIKIQQNADFLLNFGNRNPCAIPCKIFEYISSRRPIISFYKSDDDASMPYLQHYPLALLLDERDPIDKNLQLLQEFVTHIKSAAIDPIDVSSLFYDNTAEPMCLEILNNGLR